MRTVYAVSIGSYSDYRVLALFNSKTDADTFCGSVGAQGSRWDEPFVEEFPLCRGGEIPKHKTVYAVVVDDDGNEARRWSFVDWKPPTDASGRSGFSNRSFEHALKSARDNLARWKAEWNA